MSDRGADTTISQGRPQKYGEPLRSVTAYVPQSLDDELRAAVAQCRASGDTFASRSAFIVEAIGEWLERRRDGANA